MSTSPQPESLARAFHEAYERLAPSFGYETREASAVAWEDVPEPNRSLMVAVAAEVLALLAAGGPWTGESTGEPRVEVRADDFPVRATVRVLPPPRSSDDEIQP